MKFLSDLKNRLNWSSKELEEPTDTDKERKLVNYWVQQVEDSGKRLRTFLKDGKETVQIYEADKVEATPFNILYSNTETIAPSLYNSVPRPVVTRRFKDEDPLGMLAAKATERMLAYISDTNSERYSTLDEALVSSVHEALVPGWGQVFVKYDADVVAETQAQETREDAAEAGEGVPGEEEQTAEDISYETICYETVPWDRFRMGYGKTWGQVPWVGRLHYMSRAELVKNYGEELGRAVKLNATSKESDEGAGEEPGKGMGEEGAVDLAVVYEIWNKLKKEVIFVSEGLPERVLKRVPDPYGLAGFFPCPAPMMFVTKISSLTPVSLYAFYKEQAQELNNLTRRAKGLIASLKYRGFYDSTVQGIEKVLQAEENTLTPVENIAALMPGQTLERIIWTVPVDMLATTLQQVMTQREVAKSVIYEITGMSDIIRGSSVASETATAQRIKSQWGGLRIKRFQKEVQRFARDLFRLSAELAAGKLEEKTWRGMTGMPFPTGAEKEELQMRVRMAVEQGLEPPPDSAERLGAPSWTDILSLLRDGIQRQYRIDIETNSTVDLEASEDKQQVGELLNAIAQVMSGLAPMIQSGAMPYEVAQSLLLAVVRRYRFGPEVEEALKKMTPPKPPEDGKAQAQQLDLQAKQMEMQGRASEMQMEAQLAQEEHKLKMEELQLKREMMVQKHQQDMQKMQMQALVTAQTPEPQGGPNAAV